MRSSDVHIVGVGCGGSYLAMHIAKCDPPVAQTLHLWDGDTVEPKNVRPQMYLPEHIGLSKVDALARQVQRWGGPSVVCHEEYITQSRPLSGVVILALDTMSARMNIWHECIERNSTVELVIELRLETTNALVHVLSPKVERHRKKWQHFWYPDEEVTVRGSCGTATSRGPIADLTACVCVWQLIAALSNEPFHNQIRISTLPLNMQTYSW